MLLLNYYLIFTVIDYSNFIPENSKLHQNITQIFRYQTQNYLILILHIWAAEYHWNARKSMRNDMHRFFLDTISKSKTLPICLRFEGLPKKTFWVISVNFKRWNFETKMESFQNFANVVIMLGIFISLRKPSWVPLFPFFLFASYLIEIRLNFFEN